ncbi:sedoheptulose-1,7-bisphosphatase [Toxoplasma gondii ME49]|uniref:Sedoheptulose-1,7 bisphosphatase, putative n=14 Tax=Toxoplasma gondii TaxID=5811 RepID=B9PW60_TOXGV|nr:sedoheptulose-1,7-bisphosphatase [Toxoplasma gondii ME49]AGT56741.1 fructose 1,6-bisphosphatase III [Toxoplasma gondii]EPR60286.1 sedoheptulose-1,7-bisphosphatase [Toxoplasma gondii GT1]ESS30937.1 sedoheptulose-1,7-bisphosphatase [Toxoplasma gondii VEG]KFG37145.1 sedoheptulose-1,7-bisphosphatase [Toxoplasma gondii p89]KFH07401.1 sedoheptulose-1,7-bisphosphatase [Toxoplasma gondii VAND]KYF38697.1 sedoheptulose-1,7-bisphosphatase [Toxoplasma gondii ARI]PIL99477.1 sedoheptulose-1,7-bisphosph|eukprot:XP_002368965.1 sedoheptulose-1,7-bisphosphatase [Toxoplasma gondii ME49]
MESPSALPSLDQLLKEQGADQTLTDLILAILDRCGKIASALQGTSVDKVGSVNEFGDEQLTVDVIAENLLRSWAQSSEGSAVRAVCSEEDIHLQECHKNGEFILCWDPLDGSSIIDCNWAVGSIVSIWRIGHHGVQWQGADTLIQKTGRQQVASLIVVYGPRTTGVVAVNVDAGGIVKEGTALDLEMKDNGKFICRGKPIIKPQAKIFSPANLRAAQDLPAYKQLIEFWMEKRYTLRYTGGLVPDVYQIFVKQQGVFCNPASKAAPAKLRMCFEVLAIALVVEAAGGRTSNGQKSLLDVAIEHMDHRSALCCGSADEIKRMEETFAALSG